MYSRLSLLVLFAVAATASSGAVLVLEAAGVILAHPAPQPSRVAATIAETVPPGEASTPQPFARLAFVTPDAPSLRLATLNDLAGHAAVDPAGQPADEAWTEASIIEAEEDPAPETSLDWGLSTQVKREAAMRPPIAVQPAGPRTASLPVVKVALAPAIPMPPTTPLSSGSVRSAPLAARLAKISPTASSRLMEKFLAAGAAWPPTDAAFVAIKDTRTLELFARGTSGAWTFIYSYKVLAASGGTGPKLKKGDKQVPEGIYKISFLNPESRYHVSMRLNYPNEFDRQMAAAEGRKDLGGDIMIHGKALSAGCLAVGDEAAEELFVLADKVGIAHVKVVIAPADFRRDGPPPPKPGAPAWLPKLYAQVASAMSEYPTPPSKGLGSEFLSAILGK